MATINGVSLGSVNYMGFIGFEGVEKAPIAEDLVYWSGNSGRVSEWEIEGILKDVSSQSTVESLVGFYSSGVPVYVDLSDLVAGLRGLGKLGELRGHWVKDHYYYRVNLKLIPGLGVTYAQTFNVYLIDVDYQAKAAVIDPLRGSFAATWSSGFLALQWDFYVDNDASAQTAILEVQTGDDIATVEIWGYTTGAGWTVIGDWGDVDAWGASKDFTDGDAQTRTFKVNVGDRGDAVSGIGTVSKRLGLEQRALISIGLGAHVDTDEYTDYGTDQLKLRIKITHSARDAKRPYPKVTLVDGSRGALPS